MTFLPENLYATGTTSYMPATIKVFRRTRELSSTHTYNMRRWWKERENYENAAPCIRACYASAIGRERINSDAGNKGGMICIEYAGGVSMSRLVCSSYWHSTGIRAASIRLLPHLRTRVVSAEIMRLRLMAPFHAARLPLWDSALSAFLLWTINCNQN